MQVKELTRKSWVQAPCPPLHDCTHQSQMHITQGTLSGSPMQRLLQSWCAGLVLYSRSESPSPKRLRQMPKVTSLGKLSSCQHPTGAGHTQNAHETAALVVIADKSASAVLGARSLERQRSEGDSLFKRKPLRSHHPHSIKLPVLKRALVTPRVCPGCHGYDLLGSSTRALFAATSRA